MVGGCLNWFQCSKGQLLLPWFQLTQICNAMNQMLLVGRGQGCEAGGGQWLMQRGEGDESRFCFLCPSGLELPLCPSGRGCITGNRETRIRLLDPRQVAALSLLKIVKQSTKLRLQCGGRCNLLGRRKKIFVCLPASHNRQQSLWNLESEWYLMCWHAQCIVDMALHLWVMHYLQKMTTFINWFCDPVWFTRAKIYI